MSFLSLFRAEWFKLSRRPLTWILLAIFLALMVVYFGMIFLLVALNDGMFTGGESQLKVLADFQVEQYRRWLSFPGVFGATFSQINSIGGICAIVLTAGAMGSEYSWGTLRLQLARHPRRERYLIAKIVALLLLILAGMGIVLVFGVGLGWLFGSLLGDAGSVGLGDILAIPLAVVRALAVMTPYVMFTLASCTFGRSLLAGVAGGLIFLSVDVSLGGITLFVERDSPALLFYNLLLQQNINTFVTLNSRSFGLSPELLVANLDMNVLPSPLQATLLIALYSISFGFAAYWWLARRDIPGAS